VAADDSTPADPVRTHEVELMLIRALLWEMLALSPNREEILANFIRSADALTETAPPGTDLEFLVELRARARMYADAARQPPTSS
jgi:hypothetical protein